MVVHLLGEGWDILDLEGLDYFESHCRDAGIIIPSDSCIALGDKCAVHTDLEFNVWVDRVFKKIRMYRDLYVPNGVKLLKHTKTKDGLNNYVFCAII